MQLNSEQKQLIIEGIRKEVCEMTRAYLDTFADKSTAKPIDPEEFRLIINSATPSHGITLGKAETKQLELEQASIAMQHFLHACRIESRYSADTKKAPIYLYNGNTGLYTNDTCDIVDILKETDTAKLLHHSLSVLEKFIYDRVPEKKPNPEGHFIATPTGILNVRTLEKMPLSPYKVFTWGVKVPFIKDMPCPSILDNGTPWSFDKWIDSIEIDCADAEKHDLIWDAVAAAILPPSVTGYKAVCVHDAKFSENYNGKSTLINFIAHICGTSMYAGIELNKAESAHKIAMSGPIFEDHIGRIPGLSAYLDYDRRSQITMEMYNPNNNKSLDGMTVLRVPFKGHITKPVPNIKHCYTSDKDTLTYIFSHAMEHAHERLMDKAWPVA